MKRTAPLRRTPFKAHRPKVTPEERRARRLVRQRSGGLCEVCARERATDWSHRVRRSQGGPWCPANGLHVCRKDHRRIDSGLSAMNTLGWHLTRNQDPLATPVFLARRGWVLLRPDGTTETCNPPSEGHAA